MCADKSRSSGHENLLFTVRHRGRLMTDVEQSSRARKSEVRRLYENGILKAGHYLLRRGSELWLCRTTTCGANNENCQEERLIKSQTVHEFNMADLMQRQKCKLTYPMERREKRGRWCLDHLLSTCKLRFQSPASCIFCEAIQLTKNICNCGE